MPSPIEAVLFDLDDTLISWEHGHGYWASFRQERSRGVHRHLAEDGHELPDFEAFDAHLRQGYRDAWRDALRSLEAVHLGDVLFTLFANLDLDLERIDRKLVMEAYGWEPIPGVEPFEDAHDVLGALHERGYRLGLVTNSMEPMAMRDIELHHHGLFEYFEVRVSAADVGYLKPHPAIYRQALDALGIAPQRGMFVGDRPGNDIAGANDIGMTSVLMSPPHLEREDTGHEPDHRIAALSELLPILDGLRDGAKGS